MKQHAYEKFILSLELVGFSAVLLLIWLDEFVDLPYLYFGAAKTPRRPQEYWFETVSILLLATAIVIATLWVFRRLRSMERLIEVCAWCRKVNAGDQWVPFEKYMKLQHDVKSTHGICPTCRASAVKRPAAAVLESSS